MIISNRSKVHVFMPSYNSMRGCIYNNPDSNVFKTRPKIVKRFYVHPPRDSSQLTTLICFLLLVSLPFYSFSLVMRT